MTTQPEHDPFLFDPEYTTTKRATKEQKAADRAAKREQKAADRATEIYWASPAGRARAAYEKGDLLFQYEQDVVKQQANIVHGFGSYSTYNRYDSADVLNAVAREGWNLADSSFVFLQQGQQSRDKMFSSGQNVSTMGRVVGYYVFKRCEPNLDVSQRAAIQRDAAQERLCARDNLEPAVQPGQRVLVPLAQLGGDPRPDLG